MIKSVRFHPLVQGMSRTDSRESGMRFPWCERKLLSAQVMET